MARIRTVNPLEMLLLAARNSVTDLSKIENQARSLVIPYAAKVIQDGVKLHLEGEKHPVEWKALLEKYGIVTHRSAFSPCQAATKLIFEDVAATSISRYAACMAWAVEQIKSKKLRVDKVTEAILKRGIIEVALEWKTKNPRKRNGIRGPKTAYFESKVKSLSPIGTLLAINTSKTPSEFLALVRKDSSGRFVVFVVDQDAPRIRTTVLRFVAKRRFIPTKHGGK